jgi:septal ring factor EnvC (AmiA/AmiB activator)
MKRDFKSLKDNNASLMEAIVSASASFNQLNESVKGLNATNGRLIKNVDTCKKQLVKMKEDLKNRQSLLLAEAHARVECQKTLARIVAKPRANRFAGAAVAPPGGARLPAFSWATRSLLASASPSKAQMTTPSTN